MRGRRNPQIAMLAFVDLQDSPYYPEMQIVCSNPALDETLLDCNHDDYFNTNPTAGNYLTSYWNPANNQFLTGAEAPPPPTVIPPPPDNSWYGGGGKHKKKKHKKHRRH